MSSVKWAFAIGALLIGAVFVGIFAQMASQGLDFTLPEQVTEPKAETKPAEAGQTAQVEKQVEPEKSVETIPEPTTVVESTPESMPVEPTQGHIVDNDLVLYWKFDDTLDNYGTAGIPGFPVGTERYVQGKIGSAFDFDGNTYVTVTNSVNPPSFSITFWVNPYQLRTQGIMDKVPSEGWASGWRIFMIGISGNIEFDAAGEVANISTPPLVVGKWSFVAVTYDSTSQTAKIYLNGVLSAEATGVDMQNNFPNNLIIASPEDYRLNGKLDEVRFYNVALGDVQIKEIYENIP